MARKRALLFFAAIAAAVVAADALGKVWAVATLGSSADGSARIEAGPLDFVMVHNTGAAFGIGANTTWLFVIVSIVIVAATLFLVWTGRCRSRLSVAALALLAGGGVGNLIDRVALGYVVDFIEFSFIDFPVFNIADACITVGVVLLLVWTFAFNTWDAPAEGGEGRRAEDAHADGIAGAGATVDDGVAGAGATVCEGVAGERATARGNAGCGDSVRGGATGDGAALCEERASSKDEGACRP